MTFRAEQQSQEEIRRREELQQSVIEAEHRAQEEGRRADRAQQRAREMEGRVRKESERANKAEQGSREMEERVRQLKGRIKEESERVRQLEGRDREESERVRQLEGRDREESERVRQLEGRVREESDRVRQFEGRVREESERVRQLEGRVKEESERANRAEREANRRVTDVKQAVQHDQERVQVLQQHVDELEMADFWEVQSDDVHLTDEEIGRGSWAVVKVAQFRGLRVAAKCLHEDLVLPYHRNIFHREMSIAAKLRHPNLLQFIGVTVEPRMNILTELMPTSLRALVNRTRLTNKQIVSIALDVARALNYLHLMRPDPILHRDLSSANVLLEPTLDDGWRAKVSDYGTVNFSQYLKTENPGSMVYSAPEAHNPEMQSPKMDIYSFGVLLIEMCTSQFPVPEIRPRLIPTIAHAQLVSLIRSCLAPDRDQRPRCSVVIEQLDAIEP